MNENGINFYSQISFFFTNVEVTAIAKIRDMQPLSPTHIVIETAGAERSISTKPFSSSYNLMSLLIASIPFELSALEKVLNIFSIFSFPPNEQSIWRIHKKVGLYLFLPCEYKIYVIDIILYFLLFVKFYIKTLLFYTKKYYTLDIVITLFFTKIFKFLLGVKYLFPIFLSHNLITSSI